jgi:hydrogenase maturation protease
MESSAMAAKKIVIMGVGNILVKDEGAGIRAMQLLESGYEMPEGVDLIDGGVLGMNLLGILEGADELILLDCVKGGGLPGEIHHFDFAEIPARIAYKDSLHQIDFVDTMTSLGLVSQPPHTMVIGVEPGLIEAWGMELTPEVEAALPKMVELCIKELKKHGMEPAPRLGGQAAHPI